MFYCPVCRMETVEAHHHSLTLRDAAIERAWLEVDNAGRLVGSAEAATFAVDAALATLREHLLARRAAAYQMPSPEAVMALREIDTLLALLRESAR